MTRRVVRYELPEFRTFDPGSMCEHPIMAMIAKRGSGKSWAVRAIMYQLKDIPVGVVISATERHNPFYEKFFPAAYIANEFDTKILEKIFERQERMIEKEERKRKQGKIIDIRIIFVMDDCLAAKSTWAKDDLIRELFLNGRHYRITYMLTMQYVLGISPELRDNIDYIFLFATDSEKTLRKIYENYVTCIDNFSLFKQIFNQLTANYGIMVIANRGERKTITDKVFKYKAPNLDNVHFTFGNKKQFIRYHDDNYNKNWRKKHVTNTHYNDYMDNVNRNKRAKEH